MITTPGIFSCSRDEARDFRGGTVSKLRRNGPRPAHLNTSSQAKGWCTKEVELRRPPNATDFRKPTGSWKTAWKTAQKAAAGKCPIHDLTHYFIAVLGETNAPEQASKSLAGHVSPKMQERYSRQRSAAKRKTVGAVAKFISGQEHKIDA